MKAAHKFPMPTVSFHLTTSVLIINVGSREEAERFSANEPFRKAGLFERVEISRMRRGQWNPEAAPKTAEGN